MNFFIARNGLGPGIDTCEVHFLAKIDYMYVYWLTLRHLSTSRLNES